MKILDTDHCIAIVRGKLELDTHMMVTEPLYVTCITVSELLYGVYRSSQAEQGMVQINLLLQGFRVLPCEQHSARIFSRLKVDLERQGMRLDDADLYIASIALWHNMVLVTHNRRHFSRVPGLVLEDWLTDG